MTTLLRVVAPETPEFIATDEDLQVALICMGAIQDGLIGRGMKIDPIKFSAHLMSTICWYIAMQRECHENPSH